MLSITVYLTGSSSVVTKGSMGGYTYTTLSIFLTGLLLLILNLGDYYAGWFDGGNVYVEIEELDEEVHGQPWRSGSPGRGKV